MFLCFIGYQAKFMRNSAESKDTILKYSDLLRGWKLAVNAKFQHNISQNYAISPKLCQLGQKKHKDMDCEYHYNCDILVFKCKCQTVQNI